ncbi:2-C-methyl-D-erythritol 2,4-cyclodiphosphate synthase [Sporolituus thermophilus DSM 23256]|uniref:Bifunctional enzyme IspD/IspF n=2 Tax=Sporolituus TaxID=909931 RepID=A0A1G7PIX4_9FIRM|nr:2-C-methyl-D-erythritol 4-phosphate cytidylyltransferase [Sporolituus thermophilus]SDF85619.1 2-C-methyl-D-erythritol 2,4-cyclodiphosphate synthase [Sporolituus thermophilus DSM 23256]
MVTAIIAAAGQGRRMGAGSNKVLLTLAGIPLVVRTVRQLAACPQIEEIIIVSGPEEMGEMHSLVSAMGLTQKWQVVAGGSERQYSVANALAAVSGKAEIIVVHDGARPLADQTAIENVIAAAREYGAAVVAVPVKDTIKVADANGFVATTPDRKKLWAVQTPQAFQAAILRQAYAQALAEGFLGTDDASLVERLGMPVKLVTGSYRNLKITTPEDMVIAAALLEGERTMRVGIGYDVHRLVAGRNLILGGVEIPYEYGLEGHSDADVLLHAIKDALLGAAALGDIGRHFPDTDPRYKGASSLKLLARVKEILAEKGYEAGNVDATVIAQKPKLAPYIAQMNANIAAVLGIDVDRVNVKATTTEGLGFTGRGEGIAAQAVATVVRR